MHQFVAHASVYESDLIWTHSEIKVCFAESSQASLTLYGGMNHKLNGLPDPENIRTSPLPFREWIKTVIQKNFRAESTGIYFSGWEDCQIENGKINSDAVVFTIPAKYMSFPGLSSIGQGSRLLEKKSHNHLDLPSYIIFSIENGRTQKEQEYIFIHEFGHLSGLRHETVRSAEAAQDPFCGRLPQAKLSTLTSEPLGYSRTLMAKKYDPISIMNLCPYFISRKTKEDVFYFSKTELTAFQKLGLQTFELTHDSEENQFFWEPKLSSQDIRLLSCLYARNPMHGHTDCQKI